MEAPSALWEDRWLCVSALAPTVVLSPGHHEGRRLTAQLQWRLGTRAGRASGCVPRAPRHGVPSLTPGAQPEQQQEQLTARPARRLPCSLSSARADPDPRAIPRGPAAPSQVDTRMPRKGATQTLQGGGLRPGIWAAVQPQPLSAPQATVRAGVARKPIWTHRALATESGTLRADPERASVLCSAGRALSDTPRGPEHPGRWLRADGAPAQATLVTSLESSGRQAEFPFSFPSFCYFGAVPRGKTHLTHKAFPEPAGCSPG